MSTLQGSSTSTMSFYSLPPELRVNIYRKIIETTRAEHSPNLREYQGLILASKQLHAEFESEAFKTSKEFHSAIQRHWPSSTLHIAIPTRLSHCVSLYISVPREQLLIGKRTIVKGIITKLHTLFKFLFDHVSEFTISIDRKASASPWSIYVYGEHVFAARQREEDNGDLITHETIDPRKQWKATDEVKVSLAAVWKVWCQSAIFGDDCEAVVLKVLCNYTKCIGTSYDSVVTWTASRIGTFEAPERARPGNGSLWILFLKGIR
jgi:hypothetical protein